MHFDKYELAYKNVIKIILFKMELVYNKFIVILNFIISYLISRFQGFAKFFIYKSGIYNRWENYIKNFCEIKL